MSAGMATNDRPRAACCAVRAGGMLKFVAVRSKVTTCAEAARITPKKDPPIEVMAQPIPIVSQL